MQLPIESAHKTAFGEKMQSAIEREYNAALRNAPRARKEHIDGGPRSMTVEHKDRGTLVASKTILYSRGKVSQEMYMVNADYLPGGSMARQAKFPEGKKMTVDEVAEVVGPEFKEMNEDPPESVKKLRKEMEEAMDADLLPVERAASEQQAEKLEAEAEANEAQAEADRQKADAARMKESRRRAARRTESYCEKCGNPIEHVRGEGWYHTDGFGRDLDLDAEHQAEPPRNFRHLRADAARMKESAGGLYGYTKGTQSDVEATIRKAQRQASKLAKALHGQDHQAMDFLRVHAKRANSKTARLLLALMDEYPQTDLLPIEQIKQAEDTPMGMYGYPSGTARLALDACSALRSGIGEVAYNLHSRRMAKHDRITGFLKEHSKTAKCGYARLLLDTYPEAPRLAAKKKLPDALKEHQFTKDDPDNPNPKGNDKDGDGETGEKPDFLKEIEDKKGKKASLRRAARRHFAGRRYDYDEVIDFLTDDKSTPELERMWKKWSEMVEDLHDRWFEGWAEANAPELLDESIDYKELAWKAFGSVTGMGIGLWEGDFLGDEHDEAFEKVVERDSKVSRFGQDLDEEISMAREGDDEESMRMASDQMLRKAFVPDSVDGGQGKTAAAPRGKAQVAIMDYLANASPGQEFSLINMTRHPLFLGMNFGSVLKAMKVLEKKGLIEVTGGPGRGDFLRKLASVKTARGEEMLRKAFVPDSVDGWLEWAEGSRTAAPIDDLFEMRDVRYPPEVGFIVDLLVRTGFGKGYGSPDAVLRWVEAGKSVPETIADITKHWRKQFKSTNPKVQAAFLKAMASIEDNAAPAKEYPPPRRRRA